MNCKLCKQSYSLTDQNKLPRVLTACGHTFCHNCINSQIQKNNIIRCAQCRTENQRSNQNFPINETLRMILQNQEKQEFCQLHGKKLQAYCQKDNQLLCLNCVLTTHKAHKVSSISQKVEKDKQILKNSFAKVQKNKKQYQSKFGQCEKHIKDMSVHYNDYLLDISLMYKQILDQIRQQQQKAFQRAKNTFEKQITKLQIIQHQIKQKIQFCDSINSVFNGLMQMDNITYLNQDSQRIYIVQSSNFKNIKIQNTKIQLNKVNLLNNVASFIEERIFLEKNKSKSQRKQNCLIKQSIGLGGSPSFQKKSRVRQPQVLQVNLSQQYQKHQLLKNKSKIQTGKNSSFCQKQKKQSKVSRQPKFITNKKANQSKQFTISVFSEEEFFQNKDSFQLDNQNFGSLTPLSIKSFMNSSHQTIRDSFYLKDSKAQFTIVQQQQCVYHFGGLANHTIEKTKLDIQSKQSTFNSKILNKPFINRSKCQVVLLKAFQGSNCFILGGKNQQGQRLSSILLFNLQKNTIQQTQFRLSQPKSGFGAIVKNQNIYIVGGSSNSSLNTLEQYVISPFKLQHKKLASMVNSRDQLGFTLGLDGYLYAGGGINNSNSILNSCEKYCFKKNKWTSIASMKNARRSFTMVALPNAVYAIGGHDGKTPLSSVQMLQYDSNCWITVSSLEKARFTHTAIYTKNFDNIIVFGGYEEEPLKTVQVYNILQNKWSYGTNLQENRFLHCSLLLSEKINSID